MVENKKFLQQAQPAFVCCWVVAWGSAEEVPPDVVVDVLVLQAPDVAWEFGVVPVLLVFEAGLVARPPAFEVTGEAGVGGGGPLVLPRDGGLVDHVGFNVFLVKSL